MGLIISRVTLIARALEERWRHGLPHSVGPFDRDVVFVLDGVGRFQFGPLQVRRALRELDTPIGTIMYDWQFGLTGEIFTDLMWIRRNRVMASRLARRLLAFRREHPRTRIHVLGFSGGAGIAVYACEALRGRPVVETLILAAPALSPEYSLARALASVERCYALVSRKDVGILGLGTTVFGTIDRRHTSAAGLRGFRCPEGMTEVSRREYDKLRQFAWDPDLRKLGHFGGHVGWLSLRLLKEHLLPLLAGRPALPDFPAQADATARTSPTRAH